jgi:ribosomal protein S18 acetylase RimI-like enzyme
LTNTEMVIKPYLPEDESAIIELWRKCDLIKSWNDPKQDIERKLKVSPELFLVGLVDSRVVAAVMGGYDGHRGWIYSLAVDPVYQRGGLGRQIMGVIEKKILAMGCSKVNLQVRADNAAAVEFYENIGYKTEDRISMGKRLVEDSSESQGETKPLRKSS